MRNNSRHSLIVFAVAVLFACDMDMGLGPSVDFEAPGVSVTAVLSAGDDREDIDISSRALGETLYVKPDITLEGECWDNVNVERVVVEKIGADGVTVDTWTVPPGKRDSKGRQKWSLEIEGLDGGEHTLRVTAYDRAGNTGSESVKQIVLLVDKDDPFIESIAVDRGAGVTVELLPRQLLEEMSPDLFDTVGYFQNQQFTIRASVTHGFSLSGSSLTLLDGEEPVLEIYAEGNPYAPRWTVTHNDLTDIDPKYGAGVHYLRVTVTATAESGNKATNQFPYLCWLPESDVPRIVLDDEIAALKSAPLLLETFDDDSLNEVYAGLIPAGQWNSISGDNDSEKLEWLWNNRQSFAIDGKKPFADNVLKAPVQKAAILIETGDESGEFKLAVFAVDENGVRAQKTATLVIADDDIPVITVDSPRENAAPDMEDGESFTLKGTVTSSTPIHELKIAWVPAGFGTAEERIRWAEAALQGGYVPEGIVVKTWDGVTLSAEQDVDIGGKVFKVHDFEQDFNVFDDFIHEGKTENEPKVLSIYTRGAGFGAFKHFRLPAFSKAPDITVVSPVNGETLIPGQVNFQVQAVSPYGIEVEAVEVEEPDGGRTALANNGGSWEGAVTCNEEGYFTYRVYAADRFGNGAYKELDVEVAAMPALVAITSPHPDGSLFGAGDLDLPINQRARNRITVSAEFSRAVLVDETGNLPMLMLEGFNDIGGGVTRYAEYKGGSGSVVLSFEYVVQPGDECETITTPAQPVVNGEAVTASFPPLAEGKRLQGSKALKADGVAPTLLDITFDGTDGVFVDNRGSHWMWTGSIEDENYIDYILEFSEPVFIQGSPMLNSNFYFWTYGQYSNTFYYETVQGYEDYNTWYIMSDNLSRLTFNRSIDDGTNQVFRYTVSGRYLTFNIDKITVNQGNCFSNTDRKLITDMAGNPIVLSDVENIKTAKHRDGGDYRILYTLGYGYNIFLEAYLNLISKTDDSYTFQLVNEVDNNVAWDQTTPKTNPNNDNMIFSYAYEYTTDLQNWIPLEASSNYEFTISGDGVYTVQTRIVALDVKGSFYVLSPYSNFRIGGDAHPLVEDNISFIDGRTLQLTIDNSSVLTALVCDNAIGHDYSTNKTLTYRLVFSKPVHTTGGGIAATITLSNDAVVNVTPVASDSPGNSLTFTHTWVGSSITGPLKVTGIDLTGVVNPAYTSETRGPVGDIPAVIEVFNRTYFED